MLGSWLLLLIVGFNLFSGLESFARPAKYAHYYKWAAFFALFIIISSIRIPTKISVKTIEFIAGKGDVGFQLFSILAILLIIAFGIALSGQLRNISKGAKKDAKVRNLERKVEKQETKRKKEQTRVREKEQKQDEKDEETQMRRDARAEAEAELSGLSKE